MITEAVQTRSRFLGTAMMLAAKILRDNELKSDLIHPNAKGYARLAATVAGVL